MFAKIEQFIECLLRTIHDCIPLFHMGHGLAPMVEVALAQVRGLLTADTPLTHFLRFFKDVGFWKMIKRPSRCCSYSAFSGWQSVWGVWTGDLGVLSCTRQPERQPCWCVLTENCRQGALFNPIWLTPPLPGSGEPARHLAGDNRLKETVGKYRVSKSDRPAALGWYVSHGLLDLGWAVWCDI